jgi:MFS superfamily sulfate permease-like transporter
MPRGACLALWLCTVFVCCVMYLPNGTLDEVSNSYIIVYSRPTSNATARLLFFVSVLRNAFVLVVLTLAAWLYTRHRRSAKGQYPIKILQTVPSGFKHVGVPSTDPALLSALAPQLPVATIILLLEHIAISKCTL